MGSLIEAFSQNANNFIIRAIELGIEAIICQIQYLFSCFICANSLTFITN